MKLLIALFINMTVFIHTHTYIYIYIYNMRKTNFKKIKK